MSVININPNPIVPVLPKLTDKTKMDIRYSLIEPFANAHIYWNNEFGELIYEIEESKVVAVIPILTQAMESVVNWPIPLTVKISTGPNCGELTSY